MNKKISVCHDLGLLKVWRSGEWQWWGLAAGSCEVHPVGDLAVLGSDWAKAVCKAVRSLSKRSFFYGEGLGWGYVPSVVLGNSILECPIKGRYRLVRNESMSLLSLGTHPPLESLDLREHSRSHINNFKLRCHDHGGMLLSHLPSQIAPVRPISLREL